MEFLLENWSVIVMLVLAVVTGDLGIKLGRVRPLIRHGFEASRDGKLDDTERLQLFKDIEAITKSLLPNKSKVD